MFFFKKRGRKVNTGIDVNRIPQHVAIIMDGNGRWAKRRGLPRKAGHAAGSEAFRTIAYYCKDLGMKYLTVYAFSTENWKRPSDEVSAIMALLEKYLDEAMVTMERDGIRLKVFGDVSQLSEKLQERIRQTNELNDHIHGFQCNVCINYGGRAELLRGVKSIAQAVADERMKPDDITEETISDSLYSSGIPDPEFIIRPSGEYRLSNFLLWQCAYSELYFTDTLWPDFDKEELNRALADYQRRDRRFGGVKS